MTLQDVVAEGDKVVTHWTYTATHEGEIMGMEEEGNKRELVQLVTMFWVLQKLISGGQNTQSSGSGNRLCPAMGIKFAVNITVMNLDSVQ